MIVQIKEAGNRLTTAQIAIREKQLGLTFPPSYREFLMRNNGGVPHPNTIDISGLRGTPTDVQEFFGIGTDLESSEIGWNMREVGDYLPANTIPIACDSGGNLFYLLLGDDVGEVRYLDLGESPPKKYFVAKDIDDFTRRLRDLDP
jgi:hypothetical protein